MLAILSRPQCVNSVMHICIGKLAMIGSDNGLSPGRRQAIIWTNAGILSIGPLGTNFSEILIGIQTFSFKKMHFKMPSEKWRPSCLSLNVLKWRLPKRRPFCSGFWALNDQQQSMDSSKYWPHGTITKYSMMIKSHTMSFHIFWGLFQYKVWWRLSQILTMDTLQAAC